MREGGREGGGREGRREGGEEGRIGELLLKHFSLPLELLESGVET